MNRPPPLSAQTQLSEALAQTAAEARPLRHASRAHARLADILAALGRREEAASELRRAAELSGGAAEDYEALAFSAFALGEHELAGDFYRTVTEIVPRDGLAWYNLATSERNIGRLDAAEAACNRALELEPDLVQAALLRAQLRTQRPGADHVGELERRLAGAGRNPAARIFLHYALGKELDDLRDYDAAFHHFATGARIRRQTLQYSVLEDISKLNRIREVFSAPALSGAPPAELPIAQGFIVGLPRSGTTMIERVITGHPEAATNGETDNLVSALMEGAGAGKDVFERVAAADPAAVQTAYARRAGGRARLVLEKLPLNYLYAGAVALTLPRARLVLVTRSAADNLFAMFSTLFGNGYPFSYDQNELAAYYLAYRDLIAHWKAALGPRLMEVQYEAFVEAPAEHGPPIAEFLGLDWRADMQRIEENRTPSATASATQIRQPIYTSARGRWRNYARHLQPLVTALRAGGMDPDADLPGDR